MQRGAHRWTNKTGTRAQHRRRPALTQGLLCPKAPRGSSCEPHGLAQLLVLFSATLSAGALAWPLHRVPRTLACPLAITPAVSY